MWIMIILYWSNLSLIKEYVKSILLSNLGIIILVSNLNAKSSLIF